MPPADRVPDYRRDPCNPTPREEHQLHLVPRPWCWYCRKVIR